MQNMTYFLPSSETHLYFMNFYHNRDAQNAALHRLFPGRRGNK